MVAIPSAPTLSRALLRRVFAYRRLLTGRRACAEHLCRRCLSPHLPKVRRFLHAGEPVHFVLPGFPAKSPSLRKVLGVLPDTAEELALTFLQKLCDEIQALYPPGARITICSDGRVFSDIVGVTDENVTLYRREIAAMITRLGTRALDTFGMDDALEAPCSFAAMRARLCERYAEPLVSLAERVRTDPSERILFNGIHRFLFEEHLTFQRGKSRTQVRRECKERAYQVIQRSQAWSRLVAERFPGSLRLSIHPQAAHSEKIGVLLGPHSRDHWLTPWHGVAVEEREQFTLMRREEAETLGARIVERRGRPAHFQAPQA
jgi:L-tyrosine isonitrile synthase